MHQWACLVAKAFTLHLPLVIAGASLFVACAGRSSLDLLGASVSSPKEKKINRTWTWTIFDVSIYLSICLSIYLSFLSIYLSIYIYIYYIYICWTDVKNYCERDNLLFWTLYYKRLYPCRSWVLQVLAGLAMVHQPRPPSLVHQLRWKPVCNNTSQRSLLAAPGPFPASWPVTSSCYSTGGYYRVPHLAHVSWDVLSGKIGIQWSGF